MNRSVRSSLAKFQKCQSTAGCGGLVAVVTKPLITSITGRVGKEGWGRNDSAIPRSDPGPKLSFSSILVSRAQRLWLRWVVLRP